MSQTASQLPKGTVVEGLRIEEVIGQGGMGTVYRATDRSSGDLLAIKIINRERAEDRKATRRFEQEARLLGKLRHPNIVNVHAIGRLPDGRYYFTMEYLDGLSLAQHLEWYGAMSLDDVVRILAQVAAALDAAHEQGAVHRDVKPGNIFLIKGSTGEEAQVKLLDFGIAKLLVDEMLSIDTTTDTVAGSPFYMSPEQCRGKEVDHRSDIYSLGLVTFEMLTGRKAFEATTLGELVLQQQTKTVHLPSQGSVRWPPAIEAALQQALHKDPTERYHRASQLVEQLADAMGDVEGGWEGIPLVADERDGRQPEIEERVSFSRTKTIIRKRGSIRWQLPVLAASFSLLGVAGILYAILAPDRSDPPPTPTIIVNPVTTAPRPDAAAPEPDLASVPDAALGETTVPPDDLSEPVRPRVRRKKRRKRRKRRRRKTKTKTKKDDVVPGMPFRF